MPRTPPAEESIFAEALEQPSPEAQAAFLDAACQGDASLRLRIEKLLKSHQEAGSFLHRPAAATLDSPLTERPGMVIGAYKLLQQIGEGGMGVVYMADQEAPVRRRVALKIIKPGMDSRQVIARFEAERQALAMMDHQNIARVLDAGTTESGRPYFVMELVHGVPITKFCDDNRLTLRQRLELFVPICHAVQHAHHKGVIHRDLKPSNILVTMYDDRPVPKVIDFGVAKAVEQRLTEKTLFTQYGTLVGTFEYMSPEQAEMNAYGVDTRSDVYSLGVLLYELLTGTTPLERARLREAALVEMVRLIKEEEPPRPSVRLSTSGTLPKVAAACRTEPTQLSQLLRGELDWIVMKCLEKDRSRRYETANGLARDVQRYLTDEPVEACPPSTLYRLRKAARKHRVLLSMAASFLSLLLIASIVSAWLAVWATDAERTAQEALASQRVAHQEALAAREKAESFSKRLVAATQAVNEGIDSHNRYNWAAAHERFAKAVEIQPELRTIYVHRAKLYTTLALWERAAGDYDRCFLLAPRAAAPMWFEHALLKRAVGDEEGYRRACHGFVDQFGGSAAGNHRYYLIRACVLSPQPPADPADLVRRAEEVISGWYVPWTVHTAGMAHLRARNFEKAAARLREALELDTREEERVLHYAPLAMALHRQGRSDEARQTLAKAEQSVEQGIKAAFEGPLGTIPVRWWDHLEGYLFYREAKALITGESAEDPRLHAIRERGLAAITYGDAYTFLQETRGHVRRQAWNDAAASFSKVLDQLPYVFRASSEEMRMCVEMVQPPELFGRLIELRPEDPRLWTARGRTYATRGEWAAAEADHVKARELRREEWSRAGRSGAGGDWSRAGREIAALTHELVALRLLAGNEAACRDLWTTIVQEQGQVDDWPAAEMLSRACTLSPNALSDWSAPVRLAELAIAKSPRTAWCLYALGIAQFRGGEHEQAIQRLEESLQVHPTWVGRGQNYVVLALACQRLGRHEEAGNWLRQARTWLEETNQAMARNKFGYAASSYLIDWLDTQILLREAERAFADADTP
jgi:serine/threonine protein kinase/Flp pilus assembly protein TadD